MITGLTESDKTVPFNSEIKASVYNPCEAVANQECQSSNQGDQILNETQVDAKKNVNIMWREGSRKEHTSNSITQSTKRSARGHSFHVRYNHSNSNIHRSPSYFNNHDNFGRPPGYRKHSANWKHAKGKPFHSGAPNLQKHTVKERASTPIPKPHTEAEVETDMTIESTTNVHKPSSLASLDAVEKACEATTDTTTKHCSADENCERSLVLHDDKKQDTLPDINQDLPMECSHLTLDKKSTCGIEKSQDLEPNHSKWADDKKVSNCTYNSNFASDNGFVVPSAANDKHTQSAEPSSSFAAKDPPDFKVPRSTSPVDSPELSNSPSTEKDESRVDVAPTSQNSSVESLESGTEETESAIGGNSKEAKLDSNTVADVQCGFDQVFTTNGLANEAVEETNKIDDCLDLLKSDDSDVGSSELYTVVDNKEEMELLNGDYDNDNVDKTSERVEVTIAADNNGKKEEPSEEDEIQNGEKTDMKKTDSSLPDVRQVTEELMEIDTNDKSTDRDNGNSSNETGKIILVDVSKNIESDEKVIQVAHCAPERVKIIENENREKRQSVCSETSDQSNDKSKRKTTEKRPSEPSGDMYSEMPPLLFLKRSLPDAESMVDKLNNKKLKITPAVELDARPNPVESRILKGSSGGDKALVGAEKGQEAPKSLPFVRKFFQRDIKGKLSKLKREVSKTYYSDFCF